MEVYETWLGQHSDNLQLCVLSTLWFLLTFFVVDLMKTFKKIAVRSTTTFRITLWTTQFERNDHDFDHTQKHEFKVQNLNWDECIMYAQMAWARVIKYVNISPFLTKVILKGFDQTCEAKGALCCKDNLVIQ